MMVCYITSGAQDKSHITFIIFSDNNIIYFTYFPTSVLFRFFLFTNRLEQKNLKSRHTNGLILKTEITQYAYTVYCKPLLVPNFAILIYIYIYNIKPCLISGYPTLALNFITLQSDPQSAYLNN